MEVDAKEIKKALSKGLDPQEMQHLKEEKRCFHCKQIGHISR